jgi:hypothetical protein
MASFSNQKHRCKHCGEGVEHATNHNGGRLSSDCCYGCRNRYTAAIEYLTQVTALLIKVEAVLQQVDADTEGIRLADEIAQTRWQSDMRRTHIVNNAEQP